MKRWIPVALIVCACAMATPAAAQCSLCARTAQQLGEKPAKSLNAAIIYLMIMPFGVVAVIGLRWWRGERRNES